MAHVWTFGGTSMWYDDESGVMRTTVAPDLSGEHYAAMRSIQTDFYSAAPEKPRFLYEVAGSAPGCELPSLVQRDPTPMADHVIAVIGAAEQARAFIDTVATLEGVASIRLAETQEEALDWLETA